MNLLDSPARRSRAGRSATAAVGIALVAPLFGAALCAPAQAGPTAIALTSDNRLLRFDTDTPGTIERDVAVSGLGDGDVLLGIDFRPSNGQLYALGTLGQLYRVNAGTGAATAVGAPLDPDAVPLEGEDFGFDFNPVPDAIRLVSDLGENLRINPNTGALIANDGALAFAGGDPNAGELPTVTASAYTNSDTDPGTGTTLYGIDSALGVLVIQNPPNEGTLTTVGSLGLPGESPLFAGFDIFGPGNQAFAATSSDPTPGLPLQTATLYDIDLATGQARGLGTVGDGTADIQGLAVIPVPAALVTFPLAAAVAGLFGYRMNRRARRQ